MRTLIIHALVFMAITAACAAQPVRDYTFHIDVVELLDHDRQVDGDPGISITSGKHTYLFTRVENKAAFEKSPEKYQVQMGGACARMGPLSGDGTTKLFAKHDGKLYVFASESCRMRFEASPEKFIDRHDPAPTCTEESRKRGRAMLGRAVDAIACVAGIDNVTAYHETLARDQESGGKNYHITNTLTLAFPDKMRTDVCWNDSCWGNVVAGAEGWMISSDGTQPMHAQQRIALRLEALHPLTILRARDDKDLIITANGETRAVKVPEEGEMKLNLVTVHRGGITATLGLDENHRVRLLSVRGRGPNSTMGTLERIYSGFHDFGGLKLPGRVDVYFDGEPVPNDSGEFVEQTINDPNDVAKCDPPSSTDVPNPS